MKVGFIGLGIMGSRMAANLQKAGQDLVVYNRSVDKAKPLVDDGAQLAGSPKQVAEQVDVIVTMLADPEVVRSITEGENGLFETDGRNKLWIDTSTVNPSFSEEMAVSAKAAGYRFLDAPVAGTKGPAEAGELVFFVGGEKADVEEAQPLFDTMGKKTIHLGEHSKGSRMKMLVNTMLAQTMLAFSETVQLGKGLGLSQETIFNVLLNVPVTPAYLQNVRPKFESGNYEPNFPLRLIRKDLHLAAISAYENGVTMPSAALAKEVYTMAMNDGLGDEDFSAIFKFLDK